MRPTPYALALLAAWMAAPSFADVVRPPGDLMWEWTAASGPVASYVAELEVDGESRTEATAERRATLLDAHVGQQVRLRAQALDADGTAGPWSPWSELVRVAQATAAPPKMRVTMPTEGTAVEHGNERVQLADFNVEPEEFYVWVESLDAAGAVLAARGDELPREPVQDVEIDRFVEPGAASLLVKACYLERLPDREWRECSPEVAVQLAQEEPDPEPEPEPEPEPTIPPDAPIRPDPPTIEPIVES